MKSLVILLFLAVANKATAQNPAPTTTYSNNQVLQSPDLFYLYWNYNTQNITFEVHVKNAAWFLFGVQGSSYSDVIVGAVYSDGTGHYSERTVYTNNSVSTNPTLNWFLLDAFNSNNYTVLKFYRNLKLQCGQTPSTPSLDITTGTNTLVFATGTTFDPLNPSITVTSLSTAQVNLLPNIAAGTQLNCVSPPSQPVFNSIPTGNYANFVDLVPGIYRLYWNVTSTNFTAEIHVQTQGWVGFGFSENGEMEDSNVVIGYIASDGTVNFTDRYITQQSVAGVKITQNQSVVLLASGTVNNYVYFKFTRFMKLCDSEHLIITQGTPYVIYAYGTSQLAPKSDIYYHGPFNRGILKLNILNIVNADIVTPSDSQYVDFTIKNVIIPRTDTYYYAQLFKIPDSLATKYHIYRYQLIMPTINVINIHHMVLYECMGSYNGTPAQSSYSSFTDIVKTTYCSTPADIWAVGGDLTLTYPSDLGYPIGGNAGYSYIVVEVHYNNPNLDIGYIDSFTVRKFITKQLRPNELGVLTIGTWSNGYGIAIPPGLSSYSVKTYCHNNCIQSVFNTNANLTNITIVGAMPHTHLTGYSVDTRLIRNGVDIGYVFANHHYDFNYQQTYLLKPYVNITKNDELITECLYNTMDRTGFTLGGESTHNEMCFNFLLYYPRNSMRDCLSIPYANDYVDLLNNLSATGDINLGGKLNYSYMSLMVGLDKTFTQLASKNITTSVANRFINFFNTTRIWEMCGNYDFSPATATVLNQIVPPNVYVEPNVCAIQTTQPTNTITSMIQSIVQSISNLFNSIASFFSNLFKRS